MSLAGGQTARLWLPIARRGHVVADPALVVDVDGAGRVLAELVAQPFHDGLHQLRVDASRAPLPGPAQQGAVRQHPRRVGREHAQHLVLGGRQLHRTPGHCNAAPIIVDDEISQHVRLGPGVRS